MSKKPIKHKRNTTRKKKSHLPQKPRRNGIKQEQKTQDTKPELIFEGICKELGLMFNKQAPLCGFFFDFFIPIRHTHKMCNKGIMVEVHGDYFHANPYKYKGKMSSLNSMQRKNLRRDKIKSGVAVRNGFHYVCVWESDLMFSVQEVKRQLKDIVSYENKLYADRHAVVLLENKKELYHEYIQHLDEFFEEHKEISPRAKQIPDISPSPEEASEQK